MRISDWSSDVCSSDLSSDGGEFLVSLLIRPFFDLCKQRKLLYKNPALTEECSLRRAALYPAELRVLAPHGRRLRLAKQKTGRQYQFHLEWCPEDRKSVV